MNGRTSSMAAIRCTFPLENYLTLKDDDDNSLKIFKECIKRKPESLALDKINDLINLAENKLENIVASTSLNKEAQCIYLKEPAYFDKDFDQKSYIQNLVNAQIHGMTIIKENKKPRFLEKYIQKCSESLREQRCSTNASELKKIDKNTENEDKNIHSNDEEVKQVVKNTKMVEINSFQETVVKKNHKSGLSIQNLPSISIRSKLIEQKFPLVDIYPSDKNNCSLEKNNIVIIHSKHDEESEINKSADIGVKSDNEDHKSDDQAHKIEEKKVDSIKKIKFLKISDDLNLGENIVLNKEDECSNDSEKQNSYIFINKSNSKMYDYDDVKILPKTKKISTLKKYGLPEIQNIYNPKQVVHRKVNYAVPKFVSSHNISYFTKSSFPQSYFSRESIVKGSHSNKHVDTKLSTKKTHSNVEYIPYSKLAVGIAKNKNSDHYVGDDEDTYNRDDAGIQDDITTNSKSETSYNNSREVSDDLITYSIDLSSGNQHVDDSYSIEVAKPSKKHNDVSKIKKSKPKENIKQTIHIIDHNKATQTDTEYIGNIEKDMRNIKDDDEEILLDEDDLVSDLMKCDMEENSILIEDNLKISTFQKETQTTITKTVDATTSPTKEISVKLTDRMSERSEERQAIVNTDKGVQTSRRQKLNSHSENSPCDTETEDKPLYNKKVSRPSKSRFNVSSASEGYVDESKSESSEVQSLGEINLTIFRRKLIRILDETQSRNSNSSFSTSLNSNIQLNSTLSSIKSDGEVSLCRNSHKIEKQ